MWRVVLDVLLNKSYFTINTLVVSFVHASSDTTKNMAEENETPSTCPRKRDHFRATGEALGVGDRLRPPLVRGRGRARARNPITYPNPNPHPITNPNRGTRHVAVGTRGAQDGPASEGRRGGRGARQRAGHRRGDGERARSFSRRVPRRHHGRQPAHPAGLALGAVDRTRGLAQRSRRRRHAGPLAERGGVAAAAAAAAEVACIRRGH